MTNVSINHLQDTFPQEMVNEYLSAHCEARGIALHVMMEDANFKESAELAFASLNECLESMY